MSGLTIARLYATEIGFGGTQEEPPPEADVVVLVEAGQQLLRFRGRVEIQSKERDAPAVGIYVRQEDQSNGWVAVAPDEELVHQTRLCPDVVVIDPARIVLMSHVEGYVTAVGDSV